MSVMPFPSSVAGVPGPNPGYPDRPRKGYGFDGLNHGRWRHWRRNHTPRLRHWYLRERQREQNYYALHFFLFRANSIPSFLTDSTRHLKTATGPKASRIRGRNTVQWG